MEEYRDVKGYEGVYQVSNIGNVRSIKSGEWKVLKKLLGSSGYYGVVLRKDKKPKTKSIHQLIAESFLGHTPCGYDIIVDHIDNDKLNNAIDNLQVVSARENVSKDRGVGSSKYRGVSWSKSKNSWVATIYYNGKQRSLKQSKCELRCAYAYSKFIRDNNIVY